MHLEENYANVETLLIALKCDQFNWQVIRDFRMVAFLVGFQGGFTKFPCYFYHWDSRNTIAHYHRRICPKRIEYLLGTATSNGTLLLTSSKYCCLRCT